ncbi:MAG: transglycosylase SLT domain-containing protein [Clostridium sp.]|uniref:transglycosylase SLT domain-containing protein n=1 Tax=Clostridium sp. TaxID=1506 RepID=UPI003EE4B8A4
MSSFTILTLLLMVITGAVIVLFKGVPRSVAIIMATGLAVSLQPASASSYDFPSNRLYSADTAFYKDFLDINFKKQEPQRLKEEHRNNKVAKAIIKAADATGTDPNFLATIANIESTMEPKAKGRVARGLMQFTPATWRLMVKRHAKKHGIKKPDIYNPYHNALMGGELLNDNKAWLRTRLKRKVSDTEAYMAHFIAPAYVVKMLKAKGSRLAKTVVPASFVAMNKNMFYRNGKPMTVNQFVTNIKRKIDDKYYEITHPEQLELANVTMCDIPSIQGTIAPTSIGNGIYCNYNTTGDWWDRHIDSVLAA